VIGVAAVLALLAVGAALGPARRAAAVDPVATLRAE
jgi:ABC-type lipoprotein release transport system permease subunit